MCIRDSYEEHGARIKNIREAVKITGKRVAILLDTKGPEIRTNDMENGAITMKIGDSVRISMTEVLGTNEKFSITYPELINDVNVGSHILLDDGLIALEVLLAGTAIVVPPPCKDACIYIHNIFQPSCYLPLQHYR